MTIVTCPKDHLKRNPETSPDCPMCLYRVRLRETEIKFLARQESSDKKNYHGATVLGRLAHSGVINRGAPQKLYECPECRFIGTARRDGKMLAMGKCQKCG